MSTLRTTECCKSLFFETFQSTDSIEAITFDRLLEWKETLLKKFAPASVALWLTLVRAVLNFAVDQEWLTKSPMKGISAGSFENRSKDRTITMEEYGKLLDACPNQEWRVIIALARIGGLRCPSELRRLRWSDVNWEQCRFLVKSPKTERHTGQEKRDVPLFPELRLELEKHRSDCEFVIQGYQKSSWQLGYPFMRIADKAGLGEVERPFDNMRMSRSNEVVRQFGTTLESLWIGHSKKTMERHYLTATEEDFAKAAG